MLLANFPALLRLYIFGLHGYLIEITFTAIWDFLLFHDWKLKGYSSMWAFFIYGSCGLCLEKLSSILLQNRTPRWIRGFIYVIVAYIWELCSGAFLSLFNACPWDYSEFQFNFCGLITLEYAPFWMFGTLAAEKLFF